MAESALPTAARFITVDEESSGQRLDNFLMRELKGVPKTHIYRIIRSGEVRRNKGRVSADDRVQAGDILRIPPLRVSAQPELKAAAVPAAMPMACHGWTWTYSSVALAAALVFATSAASASLIRAFAAASDASTFSRVAAAASPLCPAVARIAPDLARAPEAMARRCLIRLFEGAALSDLKLGMPMELVLTEFAPGRNTFAFRPVQ